MVEIELLDVTKLILTEEVSEKYREEECEYYFITKQMIAKLSMRYAEQSDMLVKMINIRISNLPLIQLKLLLILPWTDLLSLRSCLNQMVRYSSSSILSWLSCMRGTLHVLLEVSSLPLS